MTETTTTLQATGEFPFTFYIEKAVAEEIDTELILEGVASTTNIDHDNERMSKEALHAMANVINEKSVPLRVEHSKSDNAIIGKVFKAWVDDRSQLHIRASLDKSHPVSSPLHHAMKSEGKKMGFSVGGLVKSAVKEFSDAAGKLVKTFYDVELKEVSVTPRPANYDSWAVSKSIAKDEAEADVSRNTAFYDEFLFANPQLDYLQVFAKSVPDSAWQKVESPSISKNNKDMTKTTEEEVDTTKKTETETEKSVTRAEFGVMVKGIETLTQAVMAIAKGMDVGPHDQNAPDKEQPKDESPTAKMADTEAHDQDAPTKDKPKDESPTAKTSAEGTDTEGTREKTSDKDKTDEYELETVTRSIQTLQAITKKLDGVKKTSDTETDSKDAEKTSDEKDETTKADDDKDETTKGIHPMDAFVVTVTKTLETMVKAMEDKGMTVLGYQKSVVDSIVNDPQMQVEIAKMMKIPGAKKSVSLGVPYMVTKGGKRYSLTANEVGTSTVEKSRTSEKKSFKDVYKTDYSSVREVEE